MSDRAYRQPLRPNKEIRRSPRREVVRTVDADQQISRSYSVQVTTAPPSPFTDAELEGVLAPPGRARTLPGRAYTSPDVFDWERRRFVEGAWFCVGRASSVTDAGSQWCVRVGSESILLVRDERAALHAFFNVCRHRGHELLPEEARGRGRSIRCPYHGWAYRLDGTLRNAPRFDDVEGFEPLDHGLVPMGVAEWHGWVFVNVSGDAEPFDRYLGNLDELVRPYAPERLQVGARRDYVVAANWKIVNENYHECYHCPSIHPELCKVTPPDSGTNFVAEGAWVGGSMDLREHAQTMSLSGESGGVPLPGLTAELLRRVLYVGIFPNLLVSLHPDYVLTHRISPLSPGQSRIECEWLFPPEVAEQDGFDPGYAVDFWDITNHEDWRACEAVQRGVSSRGYRPGPLATQEDAVHQFLTLVGKGYRDGRVTRPETLATRARLGAPS